MLCIEVSHNYSNVSMSAQPGSRIPLSMITLVTFNLVPLYGVFAWGWQSSDTRKVLALPRFSA